MTTLIKSKIDTNNIISDDSKRSSRSETNSKIASSVKELGTTSLDKSLQSDMGTSVGYYSITKASGPRLEFYGR